MERRIDLDAPLDYIELQIFPSHNRYEACVSTSNTAEKVASGDLEELLLHLPQVKDLSSKNSNSNFKILAPEDVNDTDWFTTDTLRRFLLIVGSPDILTIGNEISQLEETRKFQLSLFAKAEFDMTSSFESKNELLRTVDLRFSELKEKLSDTLHQATSNKCSPKDISNIENLAHHLGAENIRDSLQKLLEPSQLKDSITERNIHIPNSQLSPPVKYGVSPAKAAQIERQLSTDSESESENSFSSEEDNQPPPMERSRTPARPSAASRRSASPMRRIQIGRGGPRRPTVLNIKSLNYPKSGTQRDGSESGQSSQEEEDEKSERLAKLRMSVQDKISLFESKKKDEGVEIQKPKTVQIQKAVLRRWSSGMSESHEPSPPPPPLVTAKDAEKTKSPSPEKNVVDDHEKDVVSSWSEQKEAELNQLFNKMMETKTKTKTKPVRRHSVTNDDNSNSKSKSKEQRGGFYENYKQKRDEKLRKEVGKRAEKDAQLQEMEKQLLDGKKSEIVSINNNKPKPQNPQKKPNQLPNPKKESPKAVKKITNKPPSQLPATRKSWPSAPSPKPTVTSTTRKPQSATPAVRPNPITKSEKPKPQSKTLKVITQPEPKTTRTKPVIDKKPATVTKSTPTTKPKPRTKAATPTATKKVIKKSSVVPVETKPFLRKGTGGGGAVVIKSKLAAQVSTEEAPVQDKAVVVETSNECEPPPKLEEALPETYVGDDVAESVHEEAKRESCNEIDVVEEELMISPSAWVERETDEIVACEERCVQVSSPRVRHSLFQMLLEETGEGESGEWGNAQIPHPHPSVHKDAPPKGFKRLLKFARKTKADLLLTDSSSPSTIFRRG